MADRPNILLVVFDSLSTRDFEAQVDRLPSLARLKSESLYFPDTYACSPESGPARASLFTGLAMATHGVWTDGVMLPDHEVTLPERFAGAGYHTWLVGRRQLAGVSNWTTEHARPYEYAHFDWAHGPLHRSRQNAYLAWLQEQVPDRYAAIFPRQANPDDTEIPPDQRAAMADLPDALSFNHWVGQQVVQRISHSPTDQPTFGIAGFVVGETMGVPLGNGPHFESLSTQALAQADQAIGAILDATKDPPATLLAVVAARGSAVPGDAPLSDDALRTPLLFHGIDRKPERIDGLVGAKDVAPTLYERAKVPTPPRIQGQSLLSEPPRGWALSRFRHPGAPDQTALTTARWKLIVAHGAASNGEHLYDLSLDPAEENDLAAHPDHQADLDAMLDQMIDARVALEDRTEPRIALF